MDGFLLVDKLAGWTSHDVVAKIRTISGMKKVGHGGTLDPLATGLLVVGLGKATKQLEQFVQGDKTYLATVRLGATSTTDDAEGEIVSRDSPQPQDDEVQLALDYFHGKQQQMPPLYAALKTKGKKYYQLARQGLYVPRRTREVVFHEVSLLRYQYPDLEIRTRVGKGTYIRSLARDIGEKLGTGGYLAALRRETVGELPLAKAHTIEEIAADWQRYLIPVGE